MSAHEPDRLSLDSLRLLAWEVDPAVLLVPARILRRVIKQHCGLGGLGLRVPHRKGYILPREDLLNIASASELGLSANQVLPDTVLLIPSPDLGRLETSTPGKVLLRCWRLLFHLHVHLAIGKRRAAGELNETALQQRVRGIGAVEFEEAREVLRQESFLLAAASGSPGSAYWPGGVSGEYEEFAAVYLELLYFDPHRREQFFPAAQGRGHEYEAIESVLAQDVEAGELFRRTRPPGSFDPDRARPSEEQVPVMDAADDDVRESASLGWLRLRADQAARRGNQVRAAVLRQRALSLSPPSQSGGILAAARADIGKLVSRLQSALQLPPRDHAEWTDCLLALLPAASQGIWNREVRFLYDLQKVCVDCERDIFAVDVVEWVVSWFHRPIKRRLPDQPLVLTVKHLRTAASRLPALRMPDAQRSRLGELLQSALRDAEFRLRQTLRPKIVGSLDAVGLSPANTAERVSRDKVVEELLDHIGETGRLAIGDLRDALARNRLKLPDLKGPIQFFAGDPLIRVNRQLASDLDGIYRRGEIYLRWLQRLTSVFFGTPAGRLLTLFLLLPVLGAFFLLKGFNELFELAHTYLGFPKIQTTQLHSFFGMHKDSFELASYAVVALFILPMLHWPAFRNGVLTGLKIAWLVVRGVIFDLPAAFLRLPLVRLALQSKVYLIFFQYLGKPLAWTLPITAVLWIEERSLPLVLGVSAGLLVAISALINTRMGMLAEEAAADWLVRTWELIHNDLIPGIFRFIIWIFNRLRERVDRVIYTVDEWLRFRTGGSALSFATKLVLGLAWFFITYVVRFALNLLIEPQINPIKHFPVVTVSHKLMLPLAISINPAVTPSTFGGVLLQVFPLEVGWANFFAFWTLAAIPGIFGFLAWELKENWRLYRANASPTLDPEMVGSHGERVINLIRPGFHAGTLPKLYSRIRRSRGTAERKGEEGLHHVKEGVRHFVERDLIAMLAVSPAWSNTLTMSSGEIRLATNCIRIDLCCPALGSEMVCLEFANRAGRLVAGINDSGWLLALSSCQRKLFHDALAGFWKLAGVELVREQIEALLPLGSEYEFTRDELIVWNDAPHSRGAEYNLNHPELPPHLIGGAVAEMIPASGSVFLFSRESIAWSEWVEQWERDQAGKEHEPTLLPAIRLLPAST